MEIHPTPNENEKYKNSGYNVRVSVRIQPVTFLRIIPSKQPVNSRDNSLKRHPRKSILQGRMSKFTDIKQDTIAAIATAPGNAGIGIVKISGPDSRRILRKIFIPKGNKGEQSHKMRLGKIFSHEEGRVIDEVLAVSMKAPRSYTGEDVIEIQAHGGNLVLRYILELVLDAGARIAEPGEFTRRAFMNGRIDLTQAEATAEIINAKSEKSLLLASRILEGQLGKDAEHIAERLLEILTVIEARIDFPEDMDCEFCQDDPIEELEKQVLPAIDQMVENYRNGHYIREGIKAGIIGRPNAGKSTLMNRLLGKERMIVTDVPGTTRDMVEESITIGGLQLVLVDTAGIHESSDPVEKIGIENTLRNIEKFDIILYLVDAEEGITEEDRDFLKKSDRISTICIFNKIDLINREGLKKLPGEIFGTRIIKISATRGYGIDELKKTIESMAGGISETEYEDFPVPNLRQKICYQKAAVEVKNAIKGLKDGLPAELIAIDLKAAFEYISEITGKVTTEDILENIFSRFCIGK